MRNPFTPSTRPRLLRRACAMDHDVMSCSFFSTLLSACASNAVAAQCGTQRIEAQTHPRPSADHTKDVLPRRFHKKGSRYSTTYSTEVTSAAKCQSHVASVSTTPNTHTLQDNSQASAHNLPDVEYALDPPSVGTMLSWTTAGQKSKLPHDSDAQSHCTTTKPWPLA